MTRIERTVLDSRSSPLRIDALQVGEGQGWLGMTLCPGKHDPHAPSGVCWQRDLDLDVGAIRDWGASAVLTLLEDHEFVRVRIEALPERIRAAGMAWIHIRIPDRCAPAEAFRQAWPEHGPDLHRRLDRGERILVHCMGGIGRTGTVVAQLLIERGRAIDDAIREVRRVRQGAIETAEQEAYLLGLRPGEAG